MLNNLHISLLCLGIIFLGGSYLWTSWSDSG